MDLGGMLGRFAGEAEAFYGLILLVAYLAGYWYLVSGIVGAVHLSSAHAMEKNGGASHPFMTMAMGGVLLSIDKFAGAAFTTLSGGPAKTGWSAIQYTAPHASQAANDIFSNVLTIVALFGWASIVRGVIAFKDATDGKHGGGFEDPAWKGFVHVLAGAACINIDRTITAVRATFF